MVATPCNEAKPAYAMQLWCGQSRAAMSQPLSLKLSDQKVRYFRDGQGTSRLAWRANHTEKLIISELQLMLGKGRRADNVKPGSHKAPGL